MLQKGTARGVDGDTGAFAPLATISCSFCIRRRRLGGVKEVVKEGTKREWTCIISLRDCSLRNALGVHTQVSASREQVTQVEGKSARAKRMAKCKAKASALQLVGLVGGEGDRPCNSKRL